MKVRIRSSRRVRAAASVMEFWPTGNYIEYMPKGTPEQRLEKCWLRVGDQVAKSLKTYEQANYD